MTTATAPDKLTREEAAERLAAKMKQLVERAASTMNEREFKQAEARSDEISARVRARAASRRGTA